jgi:hypothetical protein
LTGSFSIVSFEAYSELILGDENHSLLSNYIFSSFLILLQNEKIICYFWSIKNISIFFGSTKNSLRAIQIIRDILGGELDNVSRQVFLHFKTLFSMLLEVKQQQQQD